MKVLEPSLDPARAGFSEVGSQIKEVDERALAMMLSMSRSCREIEAHDPLEPGPPAERI
jgi:hypothetical protein